MSVHDTKAYPWINTELKYIDAALKTGVTILDICLGA